MKYICEHPKPDPGIRLSKHFSERPVPVQDIHCCSKASFELRINRNEPTILIRSLQWNLNKYVWMSWLDWKHTCALFRRNNCCTKWTFFFPSFLVMTITFTKLVVRHIVGHYVGAAYPYLFREKGNLMIEFRNVFIYIVASHCQRSIRETRLINIKNHFPWFVCRKEIDAQCKRSQIKIHT